MEKSPKPSPGPQRAGVEFPECLHTSTGSMGNKGDELGICVQLQGCDVVGAMKTCWVGSHDWSVMVEGCWIFRKDRMGRTKGSRPLCERAAGAQGALSGDG